MRASCRMQKDEKGPGLHSTRGARAPPTPTPRAALERAATLCAHTILPWPADSDRERRASICLGLALHRRARGSATAGEGH